MGQNEVKISIDNYILTLVSLRQNKLLIECNRVNHRNKLIR